jgi:hypothetical protein
LNVQVNLQTVDRGYEGCEDEEDHYYYYDEYEYEYEKGYREEGEEVVEEDIDVE